MFRKKTLFILLLIMTIPAFSTLFRSGFFPMHDDMQVMRLLQMDKCIKDAQIPCRWVPDMGYGYGYPQFNYYSPLPYYLMEGIHLLGFSYLDSVKAFFVLTVIISAWGMYLLGSTLWGRGGGFLSALFYIYVPYRAVDMYVRGAVGELAAFTILPFIFLYSYRMVEGKKKAVLGFAISASPLFTSHNITAIMVLPLLLLWVIFLQKNVVKKVPYREVLKNLFIGLAWGLGISSFFIIPAWFEQNLVHIESLTGGYFNYVSHFVGLRTLLFGNYWGYGVSMAGRFDEINLSIGVLHWFFALLGLLSLWVSKRRKEKNTALFLIILSFLAIFMIHPRSSFVLQNLSILKFFQFPWRFLIIISFLLSLATGAIVYLLKNKKTLVYLILSIICLLYLFYSSFFKPKNWLNITDSEKFSGESWKLQQTVSIFDYLPVYASYAPKEQAPSEPILEGKVLSGDKGTNWQRWRLTTPEVQTLVVLPVFYFPNWVVKVDGRVVDVSAFGDLGLLSFNMEKGMHEVYAKLSDTPVRSFSNLVSLGSLLAIPIYLRRKK